MEILNSLSCLYYRSRCPITLAGYFRKRIPLGASRGIASPAQTVEFDRDRSQRFSPTTTPLIPLPSLHHASLLVRPAEPLDDASFLVHDPSRFNDESYAENPDQRLPHTYSPERPVSEEDLKKLGVLHWSIPVENWEPQIDAVAKERDYKNRDNLNVTREGLGDQYEGKLKMFFAE